MLHCCLLLHCQPHFGLQLAAARAAQQEGWIEPLTSIKRASSSQAWSPALRPRQQSQVHRAACSKAVQQSAHHEGLHIPQVVFERQVAVVHRLGECGLGSRQVCALLLREVYGICWCSSHSSRSPCCQCGHLQHAQSGSTMCRPTAEICWTGEAHTRHAQRAGSIGQQVATEQCHISSPFSHLLMQASAGVCTVDQDRQLMSKPCDDHSTGFCCGLVISPIPAVDLTC